MDLIRAFSEHGAPGQRGRSLPAITVHKVSGGPEHDLDGSAGNAIPRIQVDSWAATDTDCDELAEAVRNVLQGFGSQAGGSLMGDVRVGAVILDNEISLPEPPTDSLAMPML